MNVYLKAFDDLLNKELYEILMLRSEIFVVEQNCVYNDLDGLDPEAFHLYASESGVIIGYVRLSKPGARFSTASIGRVVTHENHRRKGISTLLMKKAIDHIENEWRETVISLSAQKYLRNFYEGLGFVVVSDVYLEDGIPHYKMVKEDNK
ncbi:MAG: GNAT family N-acetyltransferase [Prolixibacteraceae bacterium]|jgi:ElaA protein|nr:GNAT family N-acetyltransferase [Prolixibacteraceae bacterium]